MGTAFLVGAALKATLLLAASALAALLWRRGSAAARHQLWTLGILGALLVPLLAWALPAMSFTAPAIVAGDDLIATAVLVTGGSTSQAWSWGLAWGIGTLLVVLRFLGGHLAARRLPAEPTHRGDWLAALGEARTALGLTRRVVLARSEAIRSPMTLGLLRPRVLLPAAADGWSPDRLRVVLLHELGHVRRRDLLVQLAAQVACAFYWWNPLAWIAAARLRIEREHACDDLVLAAGVRPSSYAADLLELARSFSPGAAGAIGIVEPSSTEARLHRILDPAAPRRPLSRWFRLATRGLTLGFAVALACTSPPRAAAPKASATVSTQRGTLELGYGSRRGENESDRFPYVGVLEHYGAGFPFLGTPSDSQKALADVEREVLQHLDELNACYQKRLAVHPELAGTVVMHWGIETSGKVNEQCVTEDTVGDDELLACVNHLVSNLQLSPPPKAPMGVSFPFVFRPKS